MNKARWETSTGDSDAARLLSVCIPTYNRACYLDQCLASVLPQAEALGVGVYVSDNASTDHTEEVIAGYQARYKQLNVMRQASNLGYDGNHHSVIGMAKSEFAWLLGDDDVMMDGALAKLIQALRDHPDCELMLLNAMIADNEMRPRGRQFDCDHDIVIDDCNVLLRQHSDKLTFGMMVINARMFNSADAGCFMGTAHFYGGGVYEYLALNHIQNGKNTIHILSEPVVSLRQGVRRWTREIGDITIRQIPMFYTLLHPLYRENAHRALKSVTGSYRIAYSMIQFRADGWLDEQYAAELAKYYTGSHRLQLDIISRLPIAVVGIIRRIGRYAARGQKAVKRMVFAANGRRG